MEEKIFKQVMFSGVLVQINTDNPIGTYLWYIICSCLIVWIIYGVVKEIIEFRKTEFDFEIVEESGKWYAIKYIIYKGKKREFDRREI